MKALGLLSLLLALLIVALLARKQLSTTHQLAPSAATSAASGAGVDVPQVGNADDARRVQQRVQDDMKRLMQDRASDVERGLGGADKP
ncbi:MAG: hypothetical protein EPO09_16845 [Aquabacterium sp.]|uniref:hypothetical protein n=1 Tax=Aquabacterium sp. TaxID=1872578 RepID=UPI0011FD2C95|nr:hypothetical protein [Aquabacterium sp.]TAK90465.1 MAG: hypothetical protein EPO09_16845 [Aquabacterium sp.]